MNPPNAPALVLQVSLGTPSNAQGFTLIPFTDGFPNQRYENRLPFCFPKTLKIEQTPIPKRIVRVFADFYLPLGL